MKKTIKAALVLISLLTVTPFAQNVCIELCTPCIGKKKDQTCKKVEEHCQCAALLDSISAAKSARESEAAASIDKLSFELQQTCENKICTRKIVFENGLFKKIQNENQPIPDEDAQALYDAKVAQNQSSMTRIEPLPPLNGECAAFCGDCPVTDKMLKAKKPKFKDKFCKKIEESCKCIEYAINAKQLDEQAKADSIADFESKVQRIENAKLLAKQIQDQATENSAQAFTVIFANKEMVALDIQKAEIATKEKQQESVASVEEKTTDAAQASDLQESSDKLASETAISEQDQDKRVFHEVDPFSSSKSEKASKGKSTYIGLSLAFEFPESRNYYDHSWGGGAPDYDFGINLGFLFRNYFNEVVSFNIGINAFFRLAEYDGNLLYIDFSTIMAEIPLGFRFGIPLGSLPVSPFIRTSFHIRKPIYHWVYIEYDDAHYHYGYYDAKEKDDGFVDIDKWEFVPLLGAGLEISRHFSFEFQWYVGSFCFHDGDIDDSYEYGSSWRLKFDVQF